jgi:hypothetical protein
MNTRELFGVVVRSIGLWQIASGTASLIAMLIMGLETHTQPMWPYMMWQPMLLSIVIGTILLLGANVIVAAVYGRSTG